MQRTRFNTEHLAVSLQAALTTVGERSRAQVVPLGSHQPRQEIKEGIPWAVLQRLEAEAAEASSQQDASSECLPAKAASKVSAAE